MGVIKRVCYSIKCNSCNTVLEDYTGELIGITNKRQDAVELAFENKWVLLGEDIWKCPTCSKSVN